jgi:hypothetical protein
MARVLNSRKGASRRDHKCYSPSQSFGPPPRRRETTPTSSSLALGGSLRISGHVFFHQSINAKKTKPPSFEGGNVSGEFGCFSSRIDARLGKMPLGVVSLRLRATTADSR